MPPPHYTLTFFVPPSHLSTCKTAIFSAGAGRHWLPSTNSTSTTTTFNSNPPTNPPAYTECCFTTLGTGQFRPAAHANPAVLGDGNAGSTGNGEGVEKLEECRVEVECIGDGVVRDAVKALRGAHPYEVPVYYVYRHEDF